MLQLFKATANIGDFRAGEIVEIEPDQWQDYIEPGWLVPAEPPINPIEGTIEEPVVVEQRPGRGSKSDTTTEPTAPGS